jgi:hypothetical protein
MGFKSDIQATNVSLSMTGRNADGDLATTLDGALTAASTSVVVDDITGFPTTADGGGVLEIGFELIKYTTLTAGTKTFSGLTRNYNLQTNDTGLIHNDGVAVEGYNIVVGGTTLGTPLRLKALSVASSGAATGSKRYLYFKYSRRRYFISRRYLLFCFYKFNRLYSIHR